MRTLIAIFLILWFSGCGSGEIKSTPKFSKDSIEIKTEKSLLGLKHREFYMEFQMKNNYTMGVDVELNNIVLDLNACSIRSSSLSIPNRTIRFTKPYETKTVVFRAEFSSPCIPTGYTISGNTDLSYNGTKNSIEYKSQFNSIKIDGNITHEDITSIFEYKVQLIPRDNQPKMEMDSKKRYKLLFLNIDSNQSVKSERIHSIRIGSSDPSKLKLIDPNNYENDNGKAHSELLFKEQNSIDLYIQTYNKSGVVNLDVSVNYTNNRGEVHDLNSTLFLTILSGEPMAFSINSLGVTYNQEMKWFEQKFLVSASDKYNNVVNIKSKINISAMAEFAKDGSGKRILYGKFSSVKGKIEADKDSHTAIFDGGKPLFNNIDPTRDFLLLFGNVSAGEALGKWDIDPYNYNKYSLGLLDAYYGDTHSNLGFAVGHNYYSEICSSESKEWELEIDSTDGIYELDDRGKTSVTLKFPAYMIGKRIALAVNFSGKERRSGEVHFETLHSFQGVKPPDNINIDLNTTETMYYSFAFEVDTGTEDRIWVKNARVVCDYKLENVQILEFEENSEIKQVSDCGNTEKGEIAYWKLALHLIDEEKAGSMTFKECQVNSFIAGF